MGLLGVEFGLNCVILVFRSASRCNHAPARRHPTKPMDSALSPLRRDELIESLAARLTAWNVRAPAIVFLQLHAPLAFLGSQFLLAAEPFLSLLAGKRRSRDLALLLEEPANVERLIARLEEMPRRRDVNRA